MGLAESLLNQFATTATEGISGLFEAGSDLEGQISSLSARITVGSALALILLTVGAALLKDRVPRLKLPLFVAMATIIIGSTLFLGASTVYLNAQSDSGGPVHWHADFEVWACGNELELKDPFEFLSNKVGSATFHEHNDHRIHLEGVVVDESVDATLGKFFHVIGGGLTDSALVVPLNDEGAIFEDEIDGDGPSSPAPAEVEPYLVYDDDGRYARFLGGQTCGDQPAYLQVFVYHYDEANKTYAQAKLSDPADYSISREPNVPPGDCIIFEFDVMKDQTDKLCEQYGVRDVDRCHQFGVEDDQSRICEAKQINYPVSDPNQEQLAPEEGT